MSGFLQRRHLEVARQDADYADLVGIDIDQPIHNVRIATVVRLPQAIRDECDLGTIGPILLRQEVAAEDR